MKRSPLKPGTKGLARGAGLKRATPLAQGSKPLARTAMKRSTPVGPTKPAKAPSKTGPAAPTRALVIARDKATCQRCGKPGTNVQHREGRGAGGRGKADRERTNGPAWLVVLCGQGNTSGCHRAVDLDREAAERDGYVIRRNGPPVDAAAVPVLTYLGWRRLTDDGQSIPI